MSYDTAQPFLSSFVLIRKGGKIAFVLRSNTDWMNGYYGLPSGKVEIGETFTACAVREAKEEVGVTIEPDHLRPVHTMYYKAKDETLSWVNVYFEVGSWEGEFTNAEPHKHSEVAWLDPKSLPKNVIPSVAAALKYIEAGEVFTEYGWN